MKLKENNQSILAISILSLMKSLELNSNIQEINTSSNRNPSPKRYNKVTEKDFIKRATEIHGNYYIYTNLNFTTMENKVSIICPHHGVFEQKADNHVHGHGCKKCNGASRKI